MMETRTSQSNINVVFLGIKSIYSRGTLSNYKFTPKFTRAFIWFYFAEI